MTPPGSELRRVRSLIADLDGIVWEADAISMTFTFVSEGTREILGYEPSEWLAEPSFWADRLHPDDRERMVSRFVRVASTGGHFDETYRMRAADDTWVWLRDLGHAVKDVAGKPATVRGLMVEITAQKVVEAERTEAEERFRRVVEHLPAIVYVEEVPSEPDAVARMLYVSPQVKDILGFAPEEWMDDPIAWARQFHPDDRARIREEYRRIEATGEPFRAVYRMYARDGSIRWFRDEAALVRDQDGAPAYWQGVMYDITGERKTEARAEASEERYRSLIEQIPAIVYREQVAGDAVELVYINSRVERLLGISPDEWMADPSVWPSAIHADDVDRVMAENARTERTGDPFQVEYRMIARDGRIIWFRDEAVLVRDEDGAPAYWQGIMLDITARKEAEMSLAEAEARYRALVEQLPAIAYIDPVDEEGTVYISPQTETILGYTPQEWYEDPHLWRRIVHPDDAERLSTNDGTEPYSAVYRLIAKDGHEVWIHDQARPVLDDEGRLVYWQGLMLDITEQRRTQELERDLEHQRLEAERLRAEDEMKTTFLHAVSHDLRTPLAAILGLAVTLGREDVELPTGETRDLAHRIAENARKLDRMVSDFLDLERLTRGVAVPHFEAVDIGALIRELVAGSDLVAERRLALDVAPIMIEADPAMVERILDNLLGNTVKHTPGDSRVWVRLDRTDDGVELIVEDDGPGVPDADKVRIFEPFRQGDAAASGSGVGLALVERFAQLHDGRAWVDDRTGGGASFHVTLATRPTGRRVDLTIHERDQTETGSSADNHA